MSKKSQKTGKITKNGRFPPNARLNGYTRFKTVDLATLTVCAKYTRWSVPRQVMISVVGHPGHFMDSNTIIVIAIILTQPSLHLSPPSKTQIFH